MTDKNNMHTPPSAVNPGLRRSGRPAIAQLRNVALAVDALGQAIDRIEPTIPAMCVMYGAPGLGKTMALGYCMAKFNGLLYKAASIENPGEILRKIALELGLQLPNHISVARMLPRVVDAMRLAERPLLVDEFDRIVQRSHAHRSVGMIELFRDLADGSRAPLLLVGEERLPVELENFPRFRDRVLAWVPAQTCDRGDARQLANLYSPGIEIADEALDWFVERTGGNARQITTTLSGARQQLLDEGRATLDLELAQTMRIAGGRAPLARRAA